MCDKGIIMSTNEAKAAIAVLEQMMKIGLDMGKEDIISVCVEC